MQRLIRFKSCKAALLLLFLALPQMGKAQEQPNRFSLMAGFSNSFDDPFCIWGAQYQRKLHKHWSVGISYSMWRLNAPGQDSDGRNKMPYVRVYPKMNDETTWKVNNIMWVFHYKFIDFYTYYQIHLSKRIKLVTGFGPSAAFGKNRVITYLWINPEPPVDVVIHTKNVNASYFGISQKNEITYSFLKDRVDAGLFLSGKYYFGLGHQIDLGFALGLNF